MDSLVYVCHGNWMFCHMDTQSYKLFKFYTAHDRTKNVCHQLKILVWNNIQGNFLNGCSKQSFYVFFSKYVSFFRTDKDVQREMVYCTKESLCIYE